MPASDPLPSIRDLLTASANAVVGTRQSVADTRRGSIYDHFAGSGAILVTREAARDRDLFRAVYLDTAEGDDLTRLVKLRFGIDRIVPSYGTGTALLTRASVAAGGGTIWEGTRILVFASAASPTARAYAAANDVAVGAGVAAITVPIRAADLGPGSAVSLTGPAIARVDDPLWDPSLEGRGDSVLRRHRPGVRRRTSAPGRARRSSRRETATPDAITAACVSQGAAYVALFDSDFTPTDDGLCHCYVADAGFSTTARLIRACTVALEGVPGVRRRPAGARHADGHRARLGRGHHARRSRAAPESRRCSSRRARCCLLDHPLRLRPRRAGRRDRRRERRRARGELSSPPPRPRPSSSAVRCHRSSLATSSASSRSSTRAPRDRRASPPPTCSRCCRRSCGRATLRRCATRSPPRSRAFSFGTGASARTRRSSATSRALPASTSRASAPSTASSSRTARATTLCARGPSTVPTLVTPAAILAAANAILGAYTAVQAQYAESILDRWYVTRRHAGLALVRRRAAAVLRPPLPRQRGRERRLRSSQLRDSAAPGRSPTRSGASSSFGSRSSPA